MEVTNIKYEYNIILKALYSKVKGKMVVEISNNTMSGHYYLFRKKQAIQETSLLDNYFRYSGFADTPIGKISYMCEGLIDELCIKATVSTRISKIKIEGYRIKEK